jgi:hypothetical protein
MNRDSVLFQLPPSIRAKCRSFTGDYFGRELATNGDRIQITGAGGEQEISRCPAHLFCRLPHSGKLR